MGAAALQGEPVLLGVLQRALGGEARAAAGAGSVEETAEGTAEKLTVRINGEEHALEVEPRLLLSDFLRDEIGLTGTHVGCEHGVCGACTVLLDGEPVRACLMFAVQTRGREITTVEGLAGPPAPDAPAATGDLHPIQRAFHETHALQCGFCTPGILMTTAAFLAETPDPSAGEIREAISGHLCRCTGYHNIVEGVARAAELLAEARDGSE